MPAGSTAAARQAAFGACERFLAGHGITRPRDVLARVIDDIGDARADRYGTGALIEDFERDLATRFGKPAAVFAPSGTMVQRIALRQWADARGCRTVAFHPTCHLEQHEQRSYAHLHGLHARLVGGINQPLTRAELDGVHEPLGALLLELPQRELGGHLPTWDELGAQVAWARERDVRVHLDGARVWETTPHYGRSLADIAGLFDSVYVSFYKILGGIAGAALLGDADFIAHARVWLRRHGGNLISMYPFVVSARIGLRERLPRIPAYCERARSIAATLSAIDGVRVTPDPPHTNMMHIYLPVAPAPMVDASVQVARERKVALFTYARPCDVPGYCTTELTIGDAAADLSDEEVGTLVRELLDRARSPGD